MVEEEKLAEANITFAEDVRKFQKYMNDMDQLSEKAKENTDNAVEQRKEIALELERAQDRLVKKDRKMVLLEEDLKVFQNQKEFYNTVKTFSRFKSQHHH